MAYKDALIAELKYESDLTKKMLEKVPVENGSWRPHEKSMTLGRLCYACCRDPALDFPDYYN